MLVIDNRCKVSYKVNEDFIFFKTGDIYYLIKESFTLIKLTLSHRDFYDKYFKHIDEDISFLCLINEDFELVENFIIENKEVYDA